MIYTITLNPSLDYVVEIDKLVAGGINRTKKEKIYPGGKGINVSIVLQNLGVENCALGFIAGFTGKEFERRVIACGCKTDFIVLNHGLSRINIKIKSERESEINGQGPVITQEDLSLLYQKLDIIQSEDILVLAGSIPGSLSEDVYKNICSYLASKNVRIVVDAAGQLLLNVLPYHPFLIKPNKQELEEVFGVDLQYDGEIICYAKKLQQMGARNVLVSLADYGAVLVTQEGQVFRRTPPDGKVVNSVGAGDSMVAGYLANYLETGSYQNALAMGLAAGSATAFSEWLASKEEILALLK